MRRDLSVTRSRLSRELWAEPALNPAKRQGISDVALATVCAVRDYRAQRQHGKARQPEPGPLRRIDPSLETIVFQRAEQTGTSAEEPECRREKDPAWHVDVPDDLKVSPPSS